MWSAVPKHWFSWDFVVQDATLQPVAEVRLSSWRERGAIAAGGVEHKVSRQGILGAFVLLKDESVVASAEKPSAFRKSFQIDHEGRRYTLKGRSFWQRGLVLLEGEKEIGSLVPTGFFTRRAQVGLPEELPLILRLFVVWLAMLLWKRDSDATASASAT
jgi:hypothetical protein